MKRTLCSLLFYFSIQFWGVLLCAVVFSLSLTLSKFVFAFERLFITNSFYRSYFCFVAFQLIGNVYSVHCFENRSLFKFAVFFMLKKTTTTTTNFSFPLYTLSFHFECSFSRYILQFFLITALSFFVFQNEKDPKSYNVFVMVTIARCFRRLIYEFDIN